MSSSYRLELDRWLAQIDVKADEVLDIGGSQLPIKGRTKSWDVGHYAIADLAHPHVDSKKPDIILDLNKGLPNESMTSRYDVIFCLEVFDYIYSPYTAFSTIAFLLKKGGKAYVSFPFIYPTHQPIEEDMFRYTEFAIRKLAKLAKLRVYSITPRRPESNLLDAFYRTERMRAAKHYDHQVTGWMVELRK